MIATAIMYTYTHHNAWVEQFPNAPFDFGNAFTNGLTVIPFFTFVLLTYLAPFTWPVLAVLGYAKLATRLDNPSQQYTPHIQPHTYKSKSHKPHYSTMHHDDFHHKAMRAKRIN